MRHGTYNAYVNGRCRCDECRRAMREYKRRRRQEIGGDPTPDEVTDRDALSDLLHELFPFGLTDDCPARRKQVA